MSDMNVKGATSTYSSYGSNRVKADSSKAAKAETKAEAGAVYEKSEAAGKAPYKINKMSAEDRAALVEQLKQDEVNRRNQLTDLVQKMFNGQAGVSKLADLFTPENLAKVSAADIAQAKEDISEDGYWGVVQTSDRIVSVAQALSGGDVSKADQLIDAIQEGFEQATKAWSDELPDICKQTIDTAVEKMKNWRDGISDVTE